jgi:hypothetical protein
MKIDEKSDNEILEIVNPIFSEITEACRNKDWNQYSQYFTEDDRNNPDHKADILDQWDNNPVLVSITKEKKLLAILRRKNEVVVAWVVNSSSTKGDFMLSLQLTNIDSQLILTGVGLH